MFAFSQHTRTRHAGTKRPLVKSLALISLLAVLAVSLFVVTQTIAGRSADNAPESNGALVSNGAQPDGTGGILYAAQATPTMQFGPILTAPPGATQPPTIDPGSVSTPLPTTPADGVGPTATPSISPTPLPMLRADLMGIQINPHMTVDDLETMLWLAERLGVRWVKFQFAWDIMEPEPGVFSEVMYSYRVFVQRAKQKEFKVLASIAKAPDWARATTEEDGPPVNPDDLASFITRIMNEIRVDLYGNSYFDAIEIWNEPNLRREWNGATLGGAEYMRLFDAGYRGVRAGEGGHSVTVVTAGLAPTGLSDGVTAIDDREFLRQMYAAGLTNPAYQNVAIGVHPYGAANPPDARWCGQDDCGEPGYNDHPTWFFLNTIEDYRAIMEQNGDGGRQLWATEFGWGTYEGFTTTEGDPALPPVDPPYLNWINQQTQAHYIIRAFEIAQSLPYMGPMILWNLNYSNQDLIDAQDARAAYALLRGGADPLRPAFLLIEQSPKQ